MTILLLASASCIAQTPVKVATGDRHGVWLKADGTVWVWGGNSHGQLGVAAAGAYVPVQLPELSGIRDVAAGDLFSAAVGSDGRLWTWGQNDEGELGNGTTENSSKPAPVASFTGAIAVSARGQHALALRSDGTVWAWGEDPLGGRSTTPKLVAGLSGVVAIATSQRHSVALKSDGTVWLWGDHGAGDLGNGNYGPTSIPRQLRGLSDVTAVAAAYQMTLALKKDGTVWAVGYGAAGQLGNGSKESSTKPVMVSGLTGVKAVAAGYMFALALKSDGTVWGWGDNHQRQLGNIQVSAAESAIPVRSGTLSGAVAIAASASHSIAITGAGVVWAWGENNGGSIGADPEILQRSDVPMRVGQAVPAECNPLFACHTAGGSVIRICGVQNPSNVQKWSGIQYRFGPESGPPELMFPEHPGDEPPQLFFSHEESKGDYRVTVRFSNGGYTYRVHSSSKAMAGVEVDDAKGKRISVISCNEAPELFAEYLRLNLPCDPQNPHGAAACREYPYGAK